jgi:hypothetical protein
MSQTPVTLSGVEIAQDVVVRLPPAHVGRVTILDSAGTVLAYVSPRHLWVTGREAYRGVPPQGVPGSRRVVDDLPAEYGIVDYFDYIRGQM